MASTFNAAADVEGLIVQMTLDEKVRLLSGKASFAANDLERLGIPSLTVGLPISWMVKMLMADRGWSAWSTQRQVF